MPTLGEVRARLRRALEDTDATAPLWSDTELNEALATAHREDGARFPREATTTLAAVAGQTGDGREAARRCCRGDAAPPSPPEPGGGDEGGALTPTSSRNFGRGGRRAELGGGG